MPGLPLAKLVQAYRGEEGRMKVGDLVRMRYCTDGRTGVGLIVQHEGETKGWDDCYFKVMWSGPWFTWEEVCNLELVK